MGEAYVIFQVSGVEMRRRVRVIVLESWPEGQDMLAALCDYLPAPGK